MSRPWRVVFRASARRDLARRTEKVQPAVIEVCEAIAEDPRRLGKPLTLELEGYWATRRGPYRVVYELDGRRRTVIVVAVGHRSDVYRRR